MSLMSELSTLLLAHLHRAARQIEVVGAYGVADGLHAEVIGIELLGVKVYVNVAFGGSADGDVADTVDAFEFVGDLVVNNFVQSGITLVGGKSILNDGERRRVDLQYHWTAHTAGQVVIDKVDV